MNIRLASDRTCNGSKMYKNVILAAFFVILLLDLTDGNCKGFECRNGRCISQNYMCDKHDDCGDGSDEIYCGNCKVDDFRCLNGKCIPRGDFCDDANDCGDNSDEEFCDIKNGTIDCPTSWLLCKSRKQCYPSSFKCDDINDCLDSSDENSCEFEIKSISGAVGAENNLTRYLLDIRRSTRSVNRWGPHFTRIAMALFLRDNNFFASSNSTGEEIAYELTVQLLAKLALKKKISTQELSLLVNAMIVSCINPREFFGVDMVAELRKRVNSTNNTNPFAILTLCNAKDLMTIEDVIRLQKRFDANLRPLWTDTRAIVAMAMTCVAKHPDTYLDQEVIKNMVEKIIQSQDKNDNLKTTALVMQALIATGTYKSKYNWVAAVEYILKEMKPSRANLQDVYYILPIFNLKSLANISSDHCRTHIKTDLEVISKLQKQPEPSIQVQVSLYLRDDKDFIRTWKIKVPSNYTFYQVLENIGSEDPSYKVRYSFSQGKPYVVGISSVKDNVEDEMFWYTYSKPLSSIVSPKLVQKSPVDIEVNERNEMILWYRSGLWINPQEDTVIAMPSP